jgi:broad specificity phosphatase PhoE
MKLVVLVSADTIRTPGHDFFTMLSIPGLIKADELVSLLHTINPDKIYVSPWLQTLQTIYPYCIQYNKTICIENSLCPINKLDEKEFLNVNCYINESIHSYNTRSSYKYLLNILDKEYTSMVFANNIHFNESDRDIRNRLYPFLNTLSHAKYHNKTIVIVTHATIRSYIYKFYTQVKHDGIFLSEIG